MESDLLAARRNGQGRLAPLGSALKRVEECSPVGLPVIAALRQAGWAKEDQQKNKDEKDEAPEGNLIQRPFLSVMRRHIAQELGQPRPLLTRTRNARPAARCAGRVRR